MADLVRPLSAEELLVLIRTELHQISDAFGGLAEMMGKMPDQMVVRTESPPARIDPGDLEAIVNAVTSLRPQAGAEEIAEAVTRRFVPPRTNEGEIAVALEEFRKQMERMGQIIGGTARSFGSAGPDLTPKLDEISGKLPDLTGTPYYEAGTGGGTVNVPAGTRVLGINAFAVSSDGSFTIDGGDSIMVRADVGRDFTAHGNWTAPTIVFDSSLDWWVVGVA